MIFNILNNGGISFKVDVDLDTNDVNVYQVSYKNYEPYFVDTPILTLTKVRQIFYGIDPFVWQWDDGERSNLQSRVVSLLIRISEQKYLLFCENKVTSFNLPPKTCIQAFHTYVGNSAVAYAFALTNTGKYIDLYYFTLNNMPFEGHVYNCKQLDQLQDMALSSTVENGQPLRHDVVLQV